MVKARTLVLAEPDELQHGTNVAVIIPGCTKATPTDMISGLLWSRTGGKNPDTALVRMTIPSRQQPYARKVIRSVPRSRDTMKYPSR